MCGCPFTLIGYPCVGEVKSVNFIEFVGLFRQGRNQRRRLSLPCLMLSLKAPEPAAPPVEAPTPVDEPQDSPADIPDAPPPEPVLLNAMDQNVSPPSTAIRMWDAMCLCR